MADDRHYVPGDHYKIDDKSGFKVRARRTRKEWTNLIVDRKIWEARHPQDFVRGVVDDQSVPDARPRQTDVFLFALQTTLTANVAAGGTTIPVASSTRILIGDNVQIMLDTGIYFRATVATVPTVTSFTIAAPGLPYAASSGNLVTDLSAIAAPSIG